MAIWLCLRFFSYIDSIIFSYKILNSESWRWFFDILLSFSHRIFSFLSFDGDSSIFFSLSPFFSHYIFFFSFILRYPLIATIVAPHSFIAIISVHFMVLPHHNPTPYGASFFDVSSSFLYLNFDYVCIWIYLSFVIYKF